MRLSNHTKNLGLSLAATCIILLVVELLCRLFIPHWAPPEAMVKSFWRYHETLGWAHEPLKEGLSEDEDFSVHVSINAHGLRDKEYSPTRTEGKRRILLLGDSFGWGYGVEQEETLDALIEGKYDNVEFVNASVPGYGTDQEYLYLKNQNMVWQPDLVILLFHPNDVYNNTYSNQYGYEKPVFRLIEGGLVLKNVPVPNDWYHKAKRFILNRTYFLRRAYFAVQGLVASDLPSVSKRNLALDVTKALVLEMQRVSAQSGADFWVVGIPWWVGVPRRQGKLEEIIDSIRSFVEVQRIRYISLEEIFSQAPRETLFKHTPHWNAYGQRLAANAIEKELAISGYLGSE